MEWVKLHLHWADGLEALTDEDEKIDEAACGRFILALLHYIKTGEKPKLTGPEKIVFAMAVADLKKDYTFLEKTQQAEEAKRQAISEARRDAANIRWGKSADANAMQNVQEHAAASTSTQEQTKPQQTEQIAPIRSKNKDIRDKNTEKDIEKKIDKKRGAKPRGVKEAQYDQRPNIEPDGEAIPQWLLDCQSEITGYSDPEGNKDAPDRPELDMRDLE